jgi:hypothetical protein
MINSKYIFAFLCSILLSQNINAQQEVITVKKVRIVSAADTIKPNPDLSKETQNTGQKPSVSTNNDDEIKQEQDLNKQIQILKEEVKRIKDKEEPVVIIRSSENEANNNLAFRYTSVGMNMTTLLSRLVPFGNGIPLSGPTTLMMRRYNGNRAFRMGLGLNASADATNINAILRIGTERKKELNSKFTFTRGVDFVLGAGSFNTPGFRFSDSEGGIIGALLSFGIEYNFNKNISLGTETLVFGGLATGNSDSGVALKIVPPVALFLNVKLY